MPYLYTPPYPLPPLPSYRKGSAQAFPQSPKQLAALCVEEVGTTRFSATPNSWRIYVYVPMDAS